MGMVTAIGAAHWRGDQMRYKAIFIAGVAVGFVAGARAGRDTYDKMVGYGQKVAGHPKVQQATSAAQAKASELAAKAPDYAKSAATSAAKTAQSQASQVPKYVSTAKQAAASKLPSRFGGAAKAPATADPAADGTVTTAQDDVAADGNLVYPVDDSSPSANRIRYTPDTP